jgi:hypothetical protein
MADMSYQFAIRGTTCFQRSVRVALRNVGALNADWYQRVGYQIIRKTPAHLVHGLVILQSTAGPEENSRAEHYNGQPAAYCIEYLTPLVVGPDPVESSLIPVRTRSFVRTETACNASQTELAHQIW